MAFVSFIVPVYNARQSIERCIDSIVKLEEKDIEIIIIDDGSTDGSGLICDQIGGLFQNVTVIHQKNEGQGSARNVGLSIASGNYILFCDSDDYYDSILLQTVLSNLRINNPSNNTLISYNFVNKWPDGQDTYHEYQACSYSNFDKVFFLSSEKAHLFTGYSVWNKIYNKQIIEKYSIRFPQREELGHKDDWAEDLFFNLQYMLHIEQIISMNVAPYLLTKHGTMENQSEAALTSRIEHMTDGFAFVYKTQFIQQNDIYKNSFWKIVVWHLQRYFYIETNSLDLESVRNIVLNCRETELLEIWIKTAINNWTDYGGRWEDPVKSEYKYLLKYFVNGNTFVYKVKNYWIWKISPRKLWKGCKT